MQKNLRLLYGNIDIYLFDQLLKGTFDDCKKVLDVGCGDGRNLIYFLRNGFDVYAVDPQEEAVQDVKWLAKSLAPEVSMGNFRIALAEQLPFGPESFDLIISSAVLHFAQNQQHFEAMLSGMWRVLKPGGYLFARLASDIGIEHLVQPLDNGRYLLPDESERFLVNQNMLLQLTQNLDAALFEPIKTTNVQNLRCMTTWCLQKM